MKVHQNIRISGRVQGVGFRFFTRRKARELGLTGFVENKDDGTVYAEIEGEKEKLAKMVEQLREGPMLAKVEDIQVLDGHLQNYQEFKIKRS